MSMSPKLIVTPLAEYVPVEWDGVNESGLNPIGERILLLPDSCSEKTSGGITLTEDLISRNTEAAETGVIIAVGPDAWLWNADRTRKYEGPKPKPGQRVAFQRYSGAMHHGADGRRYRLMEDRHVGAFFDQHATLRVGPRGTARDDTPMRVAKVTKPPLIVPA